MTFTTGAADTSATVYFWNPASNNATGYGDDMTLSLVPTAPATDAMVNTACNSCLDIYGNGKSAGTASEIWTCNHGADQQFTRASNSGLQVYGGTSTMCLDVSGGSTSPVPLL